MASPGTALASVASPTSAEHVYILRLIGSDETYRFTDAISLKELVVELRVLGAPAASDSGRQLFIPWHAISTIEEVL